MKKYIAILAVLFASGSYAQSGDINQLVPHDAPTVCCVEEIACDLKTQRGLLEIVFTTDSHYLKFVDDAYMLGHKEDPLAELDSAAVQFGFARIEMPYWPGPEGQRIYDLHVIGIGGRTWVYEEFSLPKPGLQEVKK